MTNKLSSNPAVITPISPKHRWRILTDDELSLLKEATFEILESVGVYFLQIRGLEIFADSGAQVDFDTQIVRMTSDLFEKALSTAPRYFNMGGREPEYGFQLQEIHEPEALDQNSQIELEKIMAAADLEIK